MLKGQVVSLLSSKVAYASIDTYVLLISTPPHTERHLLIITIKAHMKRAESTINIRITGEGRTIEVVFREPVLVV